MHMVQPQLVPPCHMSKIIILCHQNGNKQSFLCNSQTNVPYILYCMFSFHRVLSFTAAFSRTARLAIVCEITFKALNLNPENTRLDLLTPDDLSFCLVLEDDKQTMEEAGIGDKANILIETRNKDQTWPEEIGSLAMSNSSDAFRTRTRALSVMNIEKGLTGLNNLGNTCFMNSALQCVSNTRPLTLYFLSKMHMYELNRTNPIGMKGHIAKRYGDLIQELWSGTVKSIAPLKLRVSTCV